MWWSDLLTIILSHYLKQVLKETAEKEKQTAETALKREKVKRRFGPALCVCVCGFDPTLILVFVVSRLQNRLKKLVRAAEVSFLFLFTTQKDSSRQCPRCTRRKSAMQPK